MSGSLLEILDLKLAWKRLKQDIIEKNTFIEFSNELKLIESNLEVWIDNIKSELVNNTYKPTPSIICEVPKQGGSTRPASYLEYEDRLIYNACVGACYEQIYSFIHNEIGHQIDISNTLSSNAESVSWTSSSYGSWKKFQDKSLKAIEDFASYVVITDISAYFENIDIKRLIDDLREIGCNNEVLNLLSKCLNTWTKLVGRGIPQGYDASQILAKFYLSHIDNFIKDDFEHFRYVDDIRIFCSSKIEAKKSLMDLVKHLRARGLNIQTSKTKILNGENAKKQIEGIQPIIDDIKKQYEKEIFEEFGNEYINFIDIEFILSNSLEETPIEIIERAFETNFSNETDSSFNKTLFRFLLKRFRNTRNPYGVKFCLNAIENHPEETRTILSYFRSLDLPSNNELFKRIEHFLASFLSSDRAIYQFQNYLIIDFFSKLDFQPSQKLMKTIRKIIFERKSELFLTCIGLNFLSKYGNTTDFETIEYEFNSYHPKTQIESIFALRNMDKTKRNLFFSRINTQNSWNEKAIILVKQIL